MKFLKFVLPILFLTSGFSYSQSVQPAKTGSFYGKSITPKGALPIAILQQKMIDVDSLEAKVTGKVIEVCTKKGCWMKLEGASGEPTRITFKDYGFFMPENILGKNVVLQGVSKVKVTSVAELQHYATDAGKSKEEIEKITLPKKEITFEADGVLVL